MPSPSEPPPPARHAHQERPQSQRHEEDRRDEREHKERQCGEHDRVGVPQPVPHACHKRRDTRGSRQDGGGSGRQAQEQDVTVTGVVVTTPVAGGDDRRGERIFSSSGYLPCLLEISPHRIALEVHRGRDVVGRQPGRLAQLDALVIRGLSQPQRLPVEMQRRPPEPDMTTVLDVASRPLESQILDTPEDIEVADRRCRIWPMREAIGGNTGRGLGVMGSGMSQPARVKLAVI